MRCDKCESYCTSSYRGRCDNCRNETLPESMRYRCRECLVWCIAPGVEVSPELSPWMSRRIGGMSVERAQPHGDVCWHCNHWLTAVDERDEPGHVRIGGKSYHVDVVHPIKGGDPDLRGFGGRVHVIQWNDGRVTRTDNLWFGGEIPAHFLDRLPDNATWHPSHFKS